jgi:hypothetical protein
VSLNEDGEFRIAARFWDAIVRLDVGEQFHIIHVRDGRLVSFYKCDSTEAARYNIRISAPESDWEELLRSPAVLSGFDGCITASRMVAQRVQAN